MSECEMLGSVVILDDLNACLSVDGRNIQGELLQEVLDRNDLTDVSSGCLATGPSYTYCSGSVCTKIDYTLMIVGAAALLSSVETKSMVDLNMSDHLPIVIKFKSICCLSIGACRPGQCPGYFESCVLISRG